MFQTFESSSTPEQGPPRLAALRAAMALEGLDGFLVPRADVHQGEYVAPRDARLEWLTGFSGSAGFAAVLAGVAGVFIDGRYRLQVGDQVDALFTPVHWPEVQLADWLKQQLPKGGRIGFDPWLHTVTQIDDLRAAIGESGLEFVIAPNLVDRIWEDQPAAPDAPFTVQPEKFAGESHQDKRQRLTEAMTAGAYVITLPDSIAWLLNIRGSDIERNPVPQAFAILHHDSRVDLFSVPGKVDDTVAVHLGSSVRLKPIDAFLDALVQVDGPLHIDPKSCPEILRLTLEDAQKAIVTSDDPCILPKACKNPTEIAGAKAAHLRDGAAMVRFLAWLDAKGGSGLTEIDVVKQLEAFRRDTNQLQDISFETICGAGPNGAIVHYRVDEQTNRPVRSGELLLVDSGGQYLDGTTDITRTVIIGEPTAEHRDCYTRVLQGMVNVSRTQFPRGVGGNHLDAIARFPLWTAGMDYDHGTGHGVGAYLSVHEGPQGLSRRANTPLEPGMILSNEPGYYRAGAFGIRIENLLVVTQAPDGPDMRDLLAFEGLTYVPFDRRLIDVALLAPAERDWIDCYHAKTLDLIGPLVTGADLDWLAAACAPL